MQCVGERVYQRIFHITFATGSSTGLQVFDMLGFEPSMWNKINIHIGGTYGNTPEDKQATMERFIV